METQKPNQKLKHLNNFREIIERYEYYIFDMDVVVWMENRILQDCVDTIKILIKQNKKVYFLTNNNRHTRKELLEKLIKAGITELCKEINDPKCILNASYLLASYIKNHLREIKKIYLIGTESFKQTLEEEGFIVVGGKMHSEKSFKINEAENFSDEIEENFDACVSGFDDEINYYKLAYATHVIMQTKKFFGATKDSCYLVNNKRFPSSVGIIKLLETTTDIQATIISKPDPRSLETIMETHGIDKINKNQILMIGDNLHTDIEFANNGGIDSLLVFTGMTEESKFYEELNKNENPLFPSPTYTMKLLNF